jgi:uncharacterized membrane protein
MQVGPTTKYRTNIVHMKKTIWVVVTFQFYLFGNSFTLVTNHQPLKWFMDFNQLIGKVVRWVSFIRNMILMSNIGLEQSTKMRMG